MRHFRLLAVSFALFLVFIILVADLGLLNDFFLFINRLPYADTLGHFILLGLLSLLVSLGFSNARLQGSGPALLKSSLLIAGLITLEEFSQLFLANRRFSLLDLWANYAGIWLFGELGALVRKRLESNSTQPEA